MSKFTFFTILFSLIVILIVGQLVLKDAIFPQEFKTQVISTEYSDENSDEEISKDEISGEETAAPEIVEPETSATSTGSGQASSKPAAGAATAPSTAPSANPIQASLSYFLDANRVGQSGFGTGKAVPFSGKIFDLFDLGTYEALQVNSFSADENGSSVGLFTELKFADEIKAQGFYGLLQNKTKVYVDIGVNETNTFGDRSFYINHRKKPNESFLVVRMRNFVYTFAYLKNYHPRVKTLISLLYTAIVDQP